MQAFVEQNVRFYIRFVQGAKLFDNICGDACFFSKKPLAPCLPGVQYVFCRYNLPLAGVLA